MEDTNRMKFIDEDGNVVELIATARIYLEDQAYLILAPPEDEENEYVFRVDKDEAGGEIYNALESDQEFLKVKKEYARILYDEEA